MASNLGLEGWEGLELQNKGTRDSGDSMKEGRKLESRTVNLFVCRAAFGEGKLELKLDGHLEPRYGSSWIPD